MAIRSPYAVLILVDDNPLEDTGPVADSLENFDLNMKNDDVFKNQISNRGRKLRSLEYV